MNENKVREKIRKLLMLSKSSNENEAKAAIAKAHMLMLEYKISEKSIKELRDEIIKKVIQKDSGLYATEYKNIYLIEAAHIVLSHCVKDGKFETGYIVKETPETIENMMNVY